jgi:hypothetical protein
MSSRRDEDLYDLLDELDGTLDALRDELREGERRGRPGPRPPTFGEVMRFTDEYTIPTVIAVLETTITSLEMLRRLLRLADPSRSTFDEPSEGRRSRTPVASVNRVGGAALSSLEEALDELGRALSEADLPEDPESRSIVEDARELTAEIESRIAAADRARRAGDRPRRGEAGRRGARRGRDDRSDAVTIDVEDEGSAARAAGADTDAGEDDEAGDATVDVEAELQSIRDEVAGTGADADRAADDPGSDADDSADG